jgi:hypothetical protein
MTAMRLFQQSVQSVRRPELTKIKITQADGSFRLPQEPVLGKTPTQLKFSIRQQK